MSQQFNIEQFERIDRNETLFQNQIKELYIKLNKLENIVYQDNPINENSESQKVEGLNKANGETPEEVNPVGQIEYKLLNKLNRILTLTNSFNIDEKAILKEIIDNLINKPRETDKEKPLTIIDINSLMNSVIKNDNLLVSRKIELMDKLDKIRGL